MRQLKSASVKVFWLIELPLSPNPFIENPTASTILLKWSPPYLWPGLSIDYYRITVSETAKNGVRNTRNFAVNATFSDTIVTFVMDANQTAGVYLKLHLCNEFLFGISAVSYDYVNNEKSEMAPFFIVGGYLHTASAGKNYAYCTAM